MNRKIPEERHYDNAVEKGSWISAAKEGEASAQEDDKHYPPERRSRLNPRILFGNREKINTFLRQIDARHPELQDKMVLGKLARLAEILRNYSTVLLIDPAAGSTTPKDTKDREREKEIMEILDDEKVAAVVERMAEDEANK